MPRAGRVCSQPGCPKPATPSGRCQEHTRQADRARGSRQQRGYDAEYERARAAALAGADRCSSCGEAFTVDNPATGGHVKALRHGGTTRHGIAPQCRRCNYGWRRTGT